MRSLLHGSITLLWDVIIPASIMFSVPYGFQQGFCRIFGWGDVSSAIGLIIGIFLGILVGLFFYSHYQDEQALKLEREELKSTEKKFIDIQNNLNTALSIMTDEQKEKYYKS